MKSIIIKNYLIRISIYTVVFVAFLLMMDNTFNGVLLDFLYRNLSLNAFYNLNANRELAIILVYGSGLILLSVSYVFKLSKLFNLASGSISEDEPEIFGESCPEELREFSQKLKEFKYDLKMNEQARKAAEQQKNDLVVYLAHDLKTPLTSVIGYLSVLAEADDLPIEQRAKYVGIALEKAYRLEQLINEFFDITRLNLQTIPANKASVNVTILLVQIIDEFFPMLEEKKIRVVQEIAPELVVFADADKLARVFDNLFRNAVNYSYEDTVIVCTAQKKEEAVWISIKNRGEHIPPEKLNHIFDKFYRLDSSRQSATGGAGLGLAIAKQIVELHNGTIEVSCKDGLTEFVIMLPM